MKNGELYFEDSSGELHSLGTVADFVSIDNLDECELIDHVNKDIERYISLLEKDIELSFTVNLFNPHILDRAEIIEEVYQKHKWGFFNRI